MMNKVVLIGRLTRDLELRKTAAGTSFVRFTIAVDRRVAQGQEKQADFIGCVAWNRTAELMTQYLHKGSLIALEGRIRTGSYDKEGQRVYTTEVVAVSVQFLEPKSAGTQRSEYSEPSYESEPVYESSEEFEEPFSLDAFDPSSEDLPF